MSECASCKKLLVHKEICCVKGTFHDARPKAGMQPHAYTNFNVIILNSRESTYANIILSHGDLIKSLRRRQLLAKHIARTAQDFRSLLHFQ